MKKAFFKFIPLLVFLIFVSVDLANAQPPPPGGTGPPCWPPPCIPIDGGIGFLLAAGVAFGAKKGYDFQNKEEQE